MGFHLVILAFIFAIQIVAAKDVYDYSVIDVTGDERAVLVLCPGLNQNGDFFLNEKPWLNYAREHQIGLMALSYKSDTRKLYNGEREGYYWPDQGSGDALLEAIRKEYGKDLPIFIYGFSGGAHFTSRFVEWKPERILAWTAYSAQFWDSPKSAEIMPPGIVACGELDGLRWQPTFAYFYEGRALGKPWIWISLSETGHGRHRAFEQFIRDFFSTALEDSNIPKNLGVFVDVDTGEEYVDPDSTYQPALLSFLPTRMLLEPWGELNNIQSINQ
ncbi:hypothetical protein [Cerasicoccus arenae]|uniref:Alpha/beta hydrolase n=1 Tax=Cerasicoccus arenae TaxID=424488 RepID=A0A8J3DD58_9BACT|nr:hypothetical protein [Cerasicoccus arenae]MBK1858027.1 hypothetical protein [Cerasicoccus arenae]GHC06596.1 hypothetical protein GCM10007047_24500 [Cerasicoccus arenae]